MLYSGGRRRHCRKKCKRNTKKSRKSKGKDHCEKKAKKTDNNFDKIVSINILISYIIYISKRERTRWK